jgi:hypothetical protein
MAMTDVKFNEWIQKGFELYKANLATLMVVWLLVLVLGILTVGVLGGPLACGAILVTLGLVDRKEPKPEIGDVFKGFNFFVQALLCAVVIFAVGFVGSAILGILPLVGKFLGTLYGMVVQTFAMFALFLIADRNMEFVPALKLSMDTVKANFWPFLGLQVVASAIASIGAAACCIGLFITMPMYGCILAVAYREVFGPPPSNG